MFAVMNTPPVLPAQASTFAEQYDILFWYVTAVCAFGGAVVYLLLIYCCFRFARTDTPRRPQRILGSNKLELLWTVIPLLFFLSFFVWGIRLWDYAINIPKLPAGQEYFVVGKQWMWKVQDPKGYRHINEMTLCEGVPVKVTGTSEDVIHDYGVPAFRSKFDVVPGRYTAAWYTPKLTDKAAGGVETHHLFCDQYCGQGHSQMVGKIHVLSAEKFAEWQEGVFRVGNKNPVDGSPSWQGRQLFLKLQCNGCHFTQSADDPYAPKAPSLEQIWDTQRELSDGRSKKATDEYIRNAIRNPALDVRSGWKAIMPAYHGGLATEMDLLNLTAYIKSLRAGDLPRRNEKSPTPIGGSPPPDSPGKPKEGEK
jgi:cytochrome c oxidase subunit II